MSAAKHSARLRNLTDVRAITRALYQAGQAIELEAERSITTGSVSGKNHTPSAPGQPPNRDTGVLDGNIETTIVASTEPTVHVTSNAPYAGMLEWGTSKMAARPYMHPAAQKKRGEAVAIVQRAVVALTKKGG